MTFFLLGLSFVAVLSKRAYYCCTNVQRRPYPAGIFHWSYTRTTGTWYRISDQFCRSARCLLLVLVLSSQVLSLSLPTTTATTTVKSAATLLGEGTCIFCVGKTWLAAPKADPACVLMHDNGSFCISSEDQCTAK